MFGKLKEAIGGGMIDKAISNIESDLQPHIDKVLNLSPEQVKDDSFYKDNVIKAAKISVEASTSGVTSLIPEFDKKFDKAMFSVRDELVIVNPDSLALVDDFQEKLPKVLTDSFKG